MIRTIHIPRQSVWAGVRIVLTVGLLVALWHAVDGDDVAAALVTASPVWIGAAVACLLAQTLLSAQRWRVTASALGQHIEIGYAIREYFLSQAVNQALPGAVMGDAARAVRARAANGLIVAGQAVFFERLAGQIAMFFAFVGAFLVTDAVAGGVDWPPAIRATLFACFFGIGIALLFILLADRSGMTAWFRPLWVALFSRKVLLQQLGLGVVITLCNLAAFSCAARAAGMDLSLVEVLALVPVLLFAMLVPLTVSGWGVREGAAAVILPLAGVSAADAVASSILFGIAIIVSALPGIVLAARS